VARLGWSNVQAICALTRVPRWCALLVAWARVCAIGQNLGCPQQRLCGCACCKSVIEKSDAMNESSQTIHLSFPFPLRERIKSNVLLSVFPFSLWVRVKAGFALTPQYMFEIILFLLFPLGGIFIGGIFFMHVIDLPLDPGVRFMVWLIVWLTVVACLFFQPLVIAVSVIANYCACKRVREPFTYLFDDSGIHVVAASYEYTHRWSGIARVKKVSEFLMFFLEPNFAHCVPIKVIESAGVLEPMIALAREHGVNVDVYKYFCEI
jgi:hypothetical protein